MQPSKRRLAMSIGNTVLPEPCSDWTFPLSVTDLPKPDVDFLRAIESFHCSLITSGAGTFEKASQSWDGDIGAFQEATWLAAAYSHRIACILVPFTQVDNGTVVLALH